MTAYRQEDSTICGLTGIVGQGISSVDLKVLKQLIFVDSLRGHHSTGLCSVDFLTGEPTTYKRALDAPDFLQLKGAEAILAEINSPFIMAHNRHATLGGRGDQSAHPFTHGDITLCHNGTLETQNNLPDHTKFGVDSENICHAFNELGAEAVLPILQGAFALTWYDKGEETFNIIRNTERPMCVAYNKNRKVWYYASERKMLEAILDRNGVNAEYQDLEAGQWVKFPFSSADYKPSVTTIKLKDPTPYTGGYYGMGGGYPITHNPKGKRQQIKRKPQVVAPTINNTLSKLGLKVGDKIEFYAEGVTTIGPAQIGIMSGSVTTAPWGLVRCYQQSAKSLAGIYDGKIVGYTFTNGVGCFIVNHPVLVDLVDDDPNNFGLEKEVKKVLAAQAKRTTQAVQTA
jgi:predicted glutamine amidotransferase